MTTLFIILFVFFSACLLSYIAINSAYISGKCQALSAPKHKWVYYLLQFTWGLPMNIAGLIVAASLMICGRRPVRYGWGWCFEHEGDWGLELGIFFIAPPDSIHTKNHEHGHGIQNIYFGPLTMFVISLPSICRFWWRKLRQKFGKPITTGYDDIWFEGQATKSGFLFMENNREEE